jgi:hypothetical protein
MRRKVSIGGGVNSNFFISDFIRLAIGGNKRRTASRKSHRSITEKKEHGIIVMRV